jgi:hypothetical protein
VEYQLTEGHLASGPTIASLQPLPLLQLAGASINPSIDERDFGRLHANLAEIEVDRMLRFQSEQLPTSIIKLIRNYFLGLGLAAELQSKKLLCQEG